ncbi:MAG: hypothetical protein E7148_03205 [Rikenellaceae bacterium]|nr:hypothetical protein [Rikenellaceae bacterium]
MGALLLIFGLLSGCLLAVLVGMIGSRRHIGFGWAFLLSVIFTPFVGLILTLLSEPLHAGADKRWGCIGHLLAMIGMLLLGMIIFLLFALITAN